MARFLGTSSGRTAGSAVGAGFTKAKVFSTPGTTTFTIPNDATKAKVFVVGAGSSYRSGTYAFSSDNCASGVDYPKSCYCACFTGHLTGAGGGYSEKTYDSTIAGKTLTINVGSIGGLSASSVAVTGESTVTGSNATESAYTWSCTSNSTARDASNDNPISLGFRLPVCGYSNVFSGYYNNGGTASGGDLNRTGGKGVLIPEILTTSYLDGVSSTIAGGGAGGTLGGSSCWVNPSILCSCMYGYHNTFGSPCGIAAWSGSSCICYYLCTNISSLSHCTTAGSSSFVNSRFTFIGADSKTCCIANCVGLGVENSLCGVSNCAINNFIKNTPTGVGAEPGNSSNNGKNGYSEQELIDATLTSNNAAGSAAGAGTPMTVSYSSGAISGYDYSFGGTAYVCTCVCYFPGCLSSTGGLCASGTPQTYCYVCMGKGYNHVFGSDQSMNPFCTCFPRGYVSCCTGGGGQNCCINRTYNIGYTNSESSTSLNRGYQIPLSGLVSDTNTNINDISYGRGAGISTSASFGGGGNRVYTNPGNGLVVVIY